MGKLQRHESFSKYGTLTQLHGVRSLRSPGDIGEGGMGDIASGYGYRIGLDSGRSFDQHGDVTTEELASYSQANSIRESHVQDGSEA